MITGAPQIPLLQPHQGADAVGPETPVTGAPGAVPDGTFASTLANAIQGTNADMTAASAMGEEFARGARDDIHGTMLALSKADIELRFASNVRNKVVDAFYELWRMQI